MCLLCGTHDVLRIFEKGHVGVLKLLQQFPAWLWVSMALCSNIAALLRNDVALKRCSIACAFIVIHRRCGAMWFDPRNAVHEKSELRRGMLRLPPGTMDQRLPVPTESELVAIGVS